MRFLAKFTFICNCCFLLILGGQFLELYSSGFDLSGKANVNPVMAVMLILFFISVFVNFLFTGIVFYGMLFRRKYNIPRWIIFINFLILFVQLFYFFL